jgi:hypothetical protein
VYADVEEEIKYLVAIGCKEKRREIGFQTKDFYVAFKNEVVKPSVANDR